MIQELIKNPEFLKLILILTSGILVLVFGFKTQRKSILAKKALEEKITNENNF